MLRCKASVNFHIKQWSEGRADGTLPFSEFAGDGENMEIKVEIKKHKWLWWLPVRIKLFLGIADKKIPIPIYSECVAKQYGFPE